VANGKGGAGHRRPELIQRNSAWRRHRPHLLLSVPPPTFAHREIKLEEIQLAAQEFLLGISTGAPPRLASRFVAALTAGVTRPPPVLHPDVVRPLVVLVAVVVLIAIAILALALVVVQAVVVDRTIDGTALASR
jgi:hypothetical protein